ncbi:unnamed protein product [Gongylonema pulchrum]|uniref:Secreted protein n=1 Tax=Gongylonema pulchrum TaxID=637853 RepID=A0A183DCT7_9BILA|nr:unnamed protein product [Gongylonema pulchrum]
MNNSSALRNAFRDAIVRAVSFARSAEAVVFHGIFAIPVSLRKKRQYVGQIRSTRTVGQHAQKHAPENQNYALLYVLVVAFAKKALCSTAPIAYSRSYALVHFFFAIFHFVSSQTNK